MKTAVHKDVAINGIYIKKTLIEMINRNGNLYFMENFASFTDIGNRLMKIL